LTNISQSDLEAIKLQVSKWSFISPWEQGVSDEMLLQAIIDDPRIVSSVSSNRDRLAVRLMGSRTEIDYIPQIPYYYVTLADCVTYSINERTFVDICEIMEGFGGSDIFDDDFEWSSE